MFNNNTKSTSGDVERFEIALDRQNGVYYAGEIVSGTVKLITRKPINSRGVRIRLRGEGFVHWHTGSGDNRTDFEGNKIYEEHRYTMFGNYFNTSTLNNAGTNAIFGSANGDGIMYIPCHENEDLRLIVRVMDYDFGKRDDLLGEIYLDTRQLVSSGAAQSFPLKRFGRAEKGEVTLSARIVPMNVLFPASASSSREEYSSICELRTHQATGLRNAEWFGGKNDVYVQAYRPPKEDVKENKALPPPETNTVIPTGTLEFPFSFPIRLDAPGTAELGVGDQSYIRYSLYANIDKAWWMDPTVRRAITVLASHPKPLRSLLFPLQYLHSDPVRLASCRCFSFCTNLGTITGDALLRRQVFASGELLDLSTTIENHTSSAVTVTISLVTTIQTRNTRYKKCSMNTYHKSAVIYSSTLSANEQFRFDGKETEARIPAAYPTFLGASGMAAARHEPLVFTYDIGIKVKPPGLCSSSYDILLPVVISAVPPTLEALEEAQGEDRSPTNQATAAGERMWSFPAGVQANHTPAEMKEALHLMKGVLVPTGGCVSTHRHDEDCSAVVPLGQQQYMPYVLSFPNSARGVAAPSAPPMPLAVAVPIASANCDALIAALQCEPDKAEAVLRWAHGNTAALDSLDPLELARVLKAVPLSLDQTAVAQQLAHCMGRSRLTCAHIAEAARASTFFATDIILAMAPYAKDPGNTGVILQSVASYDRDCVLKAFSGSI